MRSQSPPDLGPCVELIVQVLLLHQELVQEPLSNSNAVTVTAIFVLLMCEIFWVWR